VFERLVAWADVYITNQLPRVRRKLRTEPADLMSINPRLVFAKGHGQGQRGDDAEAGGFDAVSFWARGGVSYVLTPEEAAMPTPQRPAQGDIPTGGFFAGGICAALVHAVRTGRGVVVDTALLNGATWTLGPDMAYASLGGTTLPMSSGAVRSPFTQTYRTADGRFVTLMMIDESRYWAQACRALGVEDLIESHPDPGTRRADWAPLTERVRMVIGGIGRDELESRLRAEGCIYSFFQSPPEVLRDPAVIENQYVMPHPTEPRLRLSAAPAQFDDELPSIRRPGPRKGEHTRDILGEIGYRGDEIESMIGAGIVIAG
jgi:crotonobetainyl-CoA:carnitine CoA-transferase CaiB-like acyl-CoA transferase